MPHRKIITRKDQVKRWIAHGDPRVSQLVPAAENDELIASGTKTYLQTCAKFARLAAAEHFLSGSAHPKELLESIDKRGEHVLHALSPGGYLVNTDKQIIRMSDIPNDDSVYTQLAEKLIQRYAQLGGDVMAWINLPNGHEFPAADEDTYFTPLHKAAYFGQDALVEMFLKHGADPLARTKYGLTPEDLAASGKYKNLYGPARDEAYDRCVELLQKAREKIEMPEEIPALKPSAPAYASSHQKPRVSGHKRRRTSNNDGPQLDFSR